MKKLLSLLFVTATLSLPAAQAQTDSKAKSVLEAVSKKIGNLKSLKANFALHLFNANGKPGETTNGTFFLKGQKYKVQLAGQEIICDTKTVWTYMKDANEVQVSNYNPSEQTLSPAKLFTNFYDNEYNYKFAGEKKVGGKLCNVVEMTPKNKNKQFAKVELAVDKAANTLVGGTVWQKNGTKVQYDISGLTPNAPVTDNYFTFNSKEHPGVDVVDLR